MNLGSGGVRAVGLVAVAGLLATFAGVCGVAPAATSAPVDEPACTGTAAPIEDAGALATSCGEDVVVADLVDPWSSTVAHADGTLEWTSGIGAVRSQSADGEWVPVDASFAATDQGRIALVAPAVAMSFSDGTTGEPLAWLSKDGYELSLDVPFDLLAPDVESQG